MWTFSSLRSIRLKAKYPSQCQLLSTATPSVSALKKPRRFYEHVGVVKSNAGTFEITLDGRYLKSPAGHTLGLKSEPLAMMVAQEWESQGEEVKMDSMHLSGLTFTALDNPCNETKDSLVENLMNFLDTDTLLYFADKQNSLSDEQQKHWAPIIHWFNSRHSLDLRPTENVVCLPEICEESRYKLRTHLLLYNFPSLIAINYGTEAVKSLLLTLSALSQHIDVETAVKLTRLEQIHQLKTWGAVEWAHDVEHVAQCARLSAATLFVHFCSNFHKY